MFPLFFLMFVNCIYIFMNSFFIFHLGKLTFTYIFNIVYDVCFQWTVKISFAWKHENILLQCVFFIYYSVTLVLHQTQCDFRQLKSGSNSAFFLLGKHFADILPHAWNQPHASKPMRTRNNPEESHSDRVEAPKLQKIRLPRNFRNWRRFTK